MPTALAVILLTKSANDIPFDLRHYPHVVYDSSIATLKRELQKRLVAFTADPKKAISSSMRLEQRARAEMDRMATHIENYFNAKKFKMVSFERIRSNINEDYSDAMLRRLIDERPERFRRVQMKGDRPGIGRVGA